MIFIWSSWARISDMGLLWALPGRAVRRRRRRRRHFADAAAADRN